MYSIIFPPLKILKIKIGSDPLPDGYFKFEGRHISNSPHQVRLILVIENYHHNWFGNFHLNCKFLHFGSTRLWLNRPQCGPTPINPTNSQFTPLLQSPQPSFPLGVALKTPWALLHFQGYNSNATLVLYYELLLVCGSRHAAVNQVDCKKSWTLWLEKYLEII